MPIWTGSSTAATWFRCLSRGKYENGRKGRWEEGDWNGDLVFDSGDMVAAFVGGGYEKGPKPAPSVPCPNPAAWCWHCWAG